MQSTLQPGMTLCGKYKILQKIGKGGMAFVFKAYSLVHNKECALKEMQDQYLDPESKDKITAQFMNEAITLSKLNHPGVPYVLETFEADGKHYLAMEYVAGDTLEDFVVNSPALLTQNQVLGIVWQITDILKYLHNLPEPVILRDLKPSNIMLNKDGKIKIIDFGIAKVFEQGNASRTMAKIKGSGSSGFAPPEQYGAGGTDKRSDIYAFGVTIYYLLTGQILPDSVDRILSGGRLDPVKDVNPTAGNAIQIMIEKMVQLKPADRFQNVEEIIEYLKQNGMSGDFPLLKPTISPYQEEIKPEYEFPDFSQEEEEQEEEEDSNIYLPRQVYNKRRNTQNDNRDEENYQRKSEIKNRFDSTSVPLQTEKLLGSNGIADGVKSDGSLRKNIEEIAAQDTTRRLNQSDISQFLTQKNPELANKLSASKKEEVMPEKEKKPISWGYITILLLVLGILGAVIYYGYNFAQNNFLPTPEKQLKLKQENNTAKVEQKKTEEKPIITYVEQSSSGKISQIVKDGNTKTLILKSLVDGKYVKLKQGEEPLPEGLKVGAEVSVIYKIPKTNPQQPYEIIKIKMANPNPKKEVTPKAKPSSTNNSSNYSSGSSTYTPLSSSNYSSGSSSYTPPNRQSNYSSGSSSYTPPSRPSSSSSGTSSSYAPPSNSSSSSSSTSESGGFTQKRSTDY